MHKYILQLFVKIYKVFLLVVEDFVLVLKLFLNYTKIINEHYFANKLYLGFKNSTKIYSMEDYISFFSF